MKVLLDINVVLDLFLEREPYFEDVYKIFEAIEHKRIEGYLCAASIDTIHYLVARAYDKTKANEVIFSLAKLFEFTEVNKETILNALHNNFDDFEDSILYTSAYLCDMDYIVTRDKKGFKASKIPVLPPSEFLAKFVAY